MIDSEQPSAVPSAAPSAVPSEGREKSADAFRTISEVAEELDVPQHVLRFWETKFAQVKPMKRAGGRRYYRPDDVTLLRRIRDLLYSEGFTIRGVQKLLRENGVRALIDAAAPAAAGAAARPDGPPEAGLRAPPQGAAPEPASEVRSDEARTSAGSQVEANASESPGSEAPPSQAAAVAAGGSASPPERLAGEARVRLETVRRRLLQLREAVAEGPDGAA